jgi:hypothetical protein
MVGSLSYFGPLHCPDFGVHYNRTIGEGIDRNEYHWSPRLTVALTGILAAAGALLAIYLIISA